MATMHLKSGLQLVCFCLTTARIRVFHPASRVPLIFAFAISDFPVNTSIHRHNIIAMASNNMSEDSSGIGQADIGGARSDDNSFIDPAEGKSWRELIEVSSAKSRDIRGSNYVQLATVDPETNEPRCRCIVFRGFQKLSKGHPCANDFGQDMSCVMRMTTDDRSQKVRQVLQKQRGSRTAELVWWFANTSEQYRVRGELIFVGGGTKEYDDDEELASARIQQWGIMNDAARLSFLQDKVPGETYAPQDMQASPPPTVGGRDRDGKALPPPDSFLLMLLKPKHVDYLRLTDMYRQVDEFSNGEWISTRVNP